MKKIICLVLAMLLCASLVLPAMAEEGIFIPSMGMTIKSATLNGKDITGSLALTTVADAEKNETAISQEDRDLLMDTYGNLSDGTASLPVTGAFEFFNMIGVALKDDAAADLAAELEKDGASIAVTLVPDTPTEQTVFAYVYADGEWIPALSTENKPDGTIVCTLEAIGPIALISTTGEAGEEDETEETTGAEETERKETTRFVPSIGYKPGPDIVDVKTNITDANGQPYGDDKIDDCIVATSVEEAKAKTTDIAQEERDLLLEIYQKLSNGTMTLPMEKDYTVRDLIDVNFFLQKCRENELHQAKVENLKEEGVTLTVTFRMGVGPKDDLYALAYNRETGEWEPIESIENNGDGTVTCVFEDVGPVAFLTDGNGKSDAPWTGDTMGNSMGIWIALMVVCAGALVALVVLKKKQK